MGIDHRLFHCFSTSIQEEVPPPLALPEFNESKDDGDGSPYEAFGELKHQELLWYYWRMAHNGSDVASMQAL